MRVPPAMDLARLKALIDLAAASPLGELDITENGYRVRIRRTAAAEPIAPSSTTTIAAMPGRIASRPPRPLSTGAHVVTSPMYGIFHRAPSPDSPPFIAPGAEVKRGDRLCLIEAMKVFNPVEADADGVIREILAENGQEVELGQGLFRIAR